MHDAEHELPRRGAGAAPLGGRSASAFLRRYWQKNALLVRRAVAGFTGVLSTQELFRLAARDEVQSRLVMQEGRSWSLEHGPFRASQLRSLPERNWTLLVQGVNLHHPAADALLRRFAFLPYARLDDVMISYAVPGGGVGPHYDSYDVFLLQGQGRRRWRFGRQEDLALRPRLPLKILARFRPTRDETLGPGDMLYLPPAFAHEGTALDTCTTYSIGFRAPSAQELAVSFVDWLRDRLQVDGEYADPGLAATSEPARIPASMRSHAARAMAAVRWTAADVAQFVGSHLSEPDAQVIFAAPSPLLTRTAFARAASRGGIRVDMGARLLYDATHVYVNGEALAPSSGREALQRLANERALSAKAISAAPLDLLYDWYRHGFVHLA
jgi:50S ribosomal protein L16 3-hydroxylase